MDKALYKTFREFYLAGRKEYMEGEAAGKTVDEVFRERMQRDVEDQLKEEHFNRQK